MIRLAVLRYLFLPVYAQWWVKQTSANVFGLLLFLYTTQMINWAVYTTLNLNNGFRENNTTQVPENNDKANESEVSTQIF